MARLIEANELKQLILAERDKIPLTLPGAAYEFGIEKPNHHGNAMRGGIRKALRCMEQCKTVDAVEVVRCKDCKHSKLPSALTQKYGLPGTLVCNNPNSPCNHRHTLGDGYCPYGERKDG